MRLLTLTIVLCLLCQALSAQETFDPYQENHPTVTGKLLGYDPAVDDGLELKFVCVVPHPQRQAEYFASPEADGSFTFTLPYPLRYQQIWFSIGDYYYGQLVVDKELSITADLPKLKKKEQRWFTEDVAFGGTDGELNRFINQYTDYEIPRREEGNPFVKIMMNREMPADEKAGQIRELYAKKQAIEKSFLEENPSPHAWILSNERLSDMYGNLFIIYVGKEMPEALFAEALRHQPKVISNDGLSAYYGYLGYFLRGLNDQERLAAYREEIFPTIEAPQEKKRLQAFLGQYQDKLEEKPYNDSLFKKESAYFYRQYKEALYAASIKKFLEKTEALPPHGAGLLKMIGGGEDIWERDHYLKMVLPTVELSWCAELMRKDWEEAREKIREANERLQAIKVNPTASPLGESLGTLPNGASLYVATPSSLDTLLGAIRSTFPDKGIILDIWATWCAPCIYDMERSKENLLKLQEMGVEVTYLCTASGTNQEGWQKKIAEMDLPATHIYLNPELSKSIMSFFELSGYPSHVFLDREGKYHPDVVHGIRNVDFESLREKLR